VPVNDSLNEFGPLSGLMADPSIEEIWINSPHRIFIAKAGVSQLTNLVLSAQDIRDLVERLLMWGGRRLDLSHPFVDARLPDGSRLHVAIPEVTAHHWAVNIRKHLVRGKSLSELAEIGVMSGEVADYLERAVSRGMNILVSGSTQAGKTTLLNALVSAVPAGNRVVTIEEVFELKPKLPDCVALQTRPANLQGEGEIPLRRLIKEALRMRPSQIVVGEIREAESLDLLIALNSGIPGMATIHANSVRDAVSKVQTLPLLAGENISHEFIAPIVASSIDLVVHTTIARDFGSGQTASSTSRTSRSSNTSSASSTSGASSTSSASSRSSASVAGVRRVVEIAAITGRVESGRVETEPLFTYSNGRYLPGLGNPDQIFERRSHAFSPGEARGNS